MDGVNRKTFAREKFELKDIGSDNVFSMKDGLVFKTQGQMAALTLFTFVRHYHWSFITAQNKYKTHRSGHQYVLFGISLYLPYRYSAPINTALFQMTKSKNPFVNLVVRVPSKVLIYSVSVFIGQFLARLYWFYKKSFNAAKNATLSTYLAYKIYQPGGKKYPHNGAFEENRPNLVA